MKKAEVLDCFPPRRCGSRESVRWAPQLNHPEKDKKLTIKRTSSRLSSQGSASSKPDPDCKLLTNRSKAKISSTEDPSDKEVPIRIVSYTCRRGKRKRETPAASSEEQKKAQTSHSQVRKGSNLKLRSKGLQIVEAISAKEDGIGGDHRMAKEAGQHWGSLPLNDLENVGNTRTRYKRQCQKTNQHCIQFSNDEAVKSEMDMKVAISKFSEVSTKFIKENGRAETDDNSVEALREMVTGLMAVMYSVGYMVQNLQERKVQRILAEKDKNEATAVAERQKLRDEIIKLKRKNQTVQSEKVRIKRERDRLKKDFVGMLDRTKDVERLQLDKEHAEANTAALIVELTNEQDKTSCQICFSTPRDAIVLPCTHFQYCHDCLQKHQQRNPECPTCRGKINGVLRCKS